MFVFSTMAEDLLGIHASPKPRRKSRLSWIFGAGWNIVDDNGTPFKKLFAAKKVWSFPWYPSQGSSELIGPEGITYGLAFAYNRYKPGKEINGLSSPGKFMFFAWDLFAKYHINEHAKFSKQYDPYISVGAGYTLRFIAPYQSTFMFNIGPGINYWFNNKWGMNFQTLAKFGMRKKFLHSGSNYLHHSFGVVYIIENSRVKSRSFIKPRYKWVHDKRNLGEKIR